MNHMLRDAGNVQKSDPKKKKRKRKVWKYISHMIVSTYHRNLSHKNHHFYHISSLITVIRDYRLEWPNNTKGNKTEKRDTFSPNASNLNQQLLYSENHTLQHETTIPKPLIS